MLTTVVDSIAPRQTRMLYWETHKRLRQYCALTKRPEYRALRHQVHSDFIRYLAGRMKPVIGETRTRIDASVSFLLRAQAASGDDGVAQGFFPGDDTPDGWRSSYPETTGYIIPSLLTYARSYGDDRVRRAALRMARWEIAIQMPTGAVQGGLVAPPHKQSAASFNTGMVLDGWLAAYDDTGDGAFLDAAQRAVAFLMSDLDEMNYLRTNGEFVSAEKIKIYNCLCAWPIYRFGITVDDDRYRQKAVAIVAAALRHQRSNGWIANNCLSRPDAPLTHTIAYSLQGIFEVGMLAERTDYILAARRSLDRLLAAMSPDGYLSGRFFDDWRPATFSSCLTGSAQLAGLSYRMADTTGIPAYREAGDRLLNFLKAVQSLDSPVAQIHGALPGSFPLMGDYLPLSYPVGATKYLLDALMLQDKFSSKESVGKAVRQAAETAATVV